MKQRNFGEVAICLSFPTIRPVKNLNILETLGESCLKSAHDSKILAPAHAGNLERIAQARDLAASRTASQPGIVRPGAGPEERFCSNESAGRVQHRTLQGTRTHSQS